MTLPRSIIADRQARHRDAAAAILSTMSEAMAPLEAISRGRGLRATIEPSPKGFTTARLIIAPDAADDVSLVVRANDCTLVTSMSVAITANATIHLGAAHRVTGAHGEDFFLWHTERETALSASTGTRIAAELRDHLIAHLDEAVAALLERANSDG